MHGGDLLRSLCGKIGADRSVHEAKLIVLSKDGGVITPRGAKLFGGFGMNLSASRTIEASVLPIVSRLE